MESYLLARCGGLVTIAKDQKRTVQFVHETARDCLLTNNMVEQAGFELGPVLSHDRLKESCLRYMNTEIPDFSLLSSAPSYQLAEKADQFPPLEILQSFPLLEYAVKNVIYHAEIAAANGIHQEAFLDHSPLAKWIALDNTFAHVEKERHTANTTMLYILAEKLFSYSIQDYMDLKPESRNNAEECERECFGTPLNAAIENSRLTERTIFVLLCPEQRFWDSKDDLERMQINGIPKQAQTAVSTIVQERPRIDHRKGQGLIHWAASYSYAHVMEFLLSKANTDPNAVYLSAWTL